MFDATLCNITYFITPGFPLNTAWIRERNVTNTYRHRSDSQEVKVSVLPKQVTFWVGGVKLLSSHDEMTGKVTSCRQNTKGPGSMTRNLKRRHSCIIVFHIVLEKDFCIVLNDWFVPWPQENLDRAVCRQLDLKCMRVAVNTTNGRYKSC